MPSHVKAHIARVFGYINPPENGDLISGERTDAITHMGQLEWTWQRAWMYAALLHDSYKSTDKATENRKSAEIARQVCERMGECRIMQSIVELLIKCVSALGEIAQKGPAAPIQLKTMVASLLIIANRHPEIRDREEFARLFFATLRILNLADLWARNGHHLTDNEDAMYPQFDGMVGGNMRWGEAVHWTAVAAQQRTRALIEEIGNLTGRPRERPLP